MVLLWTVGCLYLFKFVFSFYLHKCPEVELLDHMVVVLLVFWETSILVFTVAAPVYIPTNSCCRRVLFPPSPPNFCCLHFNDSYSDRCGVISHCVLICISLIINDVEHLFMCLLPFVCLLWKNIYLGLLVYILIVFFFVCLFILSCRSCLCILHINPLLVVSFANIFSYRLSFLFCQWFPLLYKSV